MDPSYAQSYAELYRSHWWWRAREELILGELRRLRPAAGWGSILDVGCGGGLFFDRLQELGSSVHGVESDPTLVLEGNPYASRITIAPFDSRLELARRFSLVLMLDVLEHLPDPVDALGQVHRVLEPGGTFCMTVPAFSALWTRHDEINRHFRRYRKPELCSLVETAGLQVVSSRYFFHWLFAAKLLARAREAIRPAPPTAPALPPRLVNGLLYRLSRVEEFLRPAVPVPFGSSILLVATRSPEGAEAA